MKKFVEENKIIMGVVPNSNLYASTWYSTYIKGSQYRRATFELIHASSAGTGTITVEASSDASGTSVAAIPFNYWMIDTSLSPADQLGAVTAATTSGFTTTANKNAVYVIEVPIPSLSDAKPFVRIKGVQGVSTAVIGAGMWHLSQPSYEGQTLPSALS